MQWLVVSCPPSLQLSAVLIHLCPPPETSIEATVQARCTTERGEWLEGVSMDWRKGWPLRWVLDSHAEVLFEWQYCYMCSLCLICLERIVSQAQWWWHQLRRCQTFVLAVYACTTSISVWLYTIAILWHNLLWVDSHYKLNACTSLSSKLVMCSSTCLHRDESFMLRLTKHWHPVFFAAVSVCKCIFAWD